MDAYILDDTKKIILMWVPKCGCTLLWKLMSQLHNIPYDRYDPRIYVLVNEKNYDLYRDYKKIIVMRNPLNRIVSSYINLFITVPLYNKPLVSYDLLAPYTKELLKNYEYLYRVDNNYVGLSFNEFLLLVSKHLDVNEHWNKQYKNKNIVYDYVVHLENIELEFNSVLEKLGIGKKFKPEKHNAFTYKTGSAKINLSNIKSTDILKNHTENIKVENFLTKENIELIKKIYSDDFILGKYLSN